jgi:hypothetical protein
MTSQAHASSESLQNRAVAENQAHVFLKFLGGPKTERRPYLLRICAHRGNYTKIQAFPLLVRGCRIHLRVQSHCPRPRECGTILALYPMPPTQDPRALSLSCPLVNGAQIVMNNE